MTRNGIEYELEKSPYIYNYDDGDNKVDFYFSSQYNLERYKDRYKNYVVNERTKFLTKYKLSPLSPVNELYHNLILGFMISFYTKIEKRGVYIVWNNILGEKGVINTRDQLEYAYVKQKDDDDERKISRTTVNEMD